MYQTGDLIVYCGSGVCRVEAVAPEGKDRRLFYTLQPLYQNQSCQIMTPVDNPRIFIRPILTRQQAQELVHSIPGVDTTPFCSRAPRELTEHYESLMRTYTPEALLRIVMSIYRKRQQLQAQRRRLGTVDEAYFRRAQELLHSELAAALDLDPQEVPDYIAREMEGL